MMLRLVTLFTLTSLQVFSQEKWDLQQCINHAMVNNITVKQAQTQYELSQLNVVQAKGTLLPSVNFQTNLNYQRGLNENPTTGTLESNAYLAGSTGLQTNYSIFNWGRRKSTISAAELNAKADALGIDRAKNDIALLVANAFLQVMLSKEQVRISEVQLQQSIAQYTNTRKLVDAGSQPELNAIQVEAQVARDTAALLQAQVLVNQGIIQLQAYLNLDLAQPFDISAPDIDKIPVDDIMNLQPEDVYETAVKSQPLQQQLAIRIEAYKMQQKASRAAMYPTLSAYGGLNSRYINTAFPTVSGLLLDQPTGAVIIDGSGNRINVLAPRQVFTTKSVSLTRQLNNNFGQNIGINISVPLLNNFQAKTEYRKSKIYVQQAALQDEQEKLNLKSNIFNAYQQAYGALQKYNAAIRNVAASQRALDFSKKRFDIGLLGTLDFLITQNNLYRAKIEAVSNRYDYIFKMKVLEFYKGQGLRL